MKTMIRKFCPQTWFITLLLFAAIALVASYQIARAAESQGARVTAVVQDVRLLSSHTAPRPASVNDNITVGTAVRTGTESRAELTFIDQTLTRLGANTVFSLTEGARTVDLGSGAILICVPKNGGTATIKTSSATAAVTGGIALLESHPKAAGAPSKFIVAEGDGWIRFAQLPDPCQLHAGQMVVWPRPPTICPPVLNIDIGRLSNGKLFTFHSLPGWVDELLQIAIEDQRVNPPSGGYTDPTGVNTTDQNVAGQPPQHEPAPHPQPTFTGSPGSASSRRKDINAARPNVPSNPNNPNNGNNGGRP
jgi:FecR protein